MCGIAGFWQPAAFSGAAARAVAGEMAGRIAHRGPDDSGIWIDDESAVALAHRRLSILDLSPAGHQPMVSGTGRFVIAFNGEIYNHLELRRELEERGANPPWRGHSDTETLLAGCEAWGIAGTLKKAVGMFAIALWDRAEKVLTLGRDRVGEKPLYYGTVDGTFIFASELKALRAHPIWRGDIDARALHLLLRYTYIPGPHTIYTGISKLEPGGLLQVRLQGGALSQTAERYWSVMEAAVGEASCGSDDEEAERLEGLLKAVLKRQMLADVPLGAFLSGGVDSSMIVALMQAQSSRKIKTFSIGFNVEHFNEAEYAKAVARHLGTEHTEFYVTEKDALDLIPELGSIYDEPFADSSQIPTSLLTRLARRQVTVALSGDGGDELFFGYERYRMVQSFWGKISVAPAPLRRAMAALLAGQAKALQNAPVAPLSAFGHRLRRFAELFESGSMPSLYEKMTGYHRWADQVVSAGVTADNYAGTTEAKSPDEALHMMLSDILRYLPDDILVKVDRAAMAASLETRVPFLDHSLVEYVLSLPLSMKYRQGMTKYLLRKVLYKHVPRELIERPKMGFGVPVAMWLRGPLRAWGEALLDERSLAASGLLDPAPIRQKWLEHQAGHCNWRYELWPVLMFQSWLQANE